VHSVALASPHPTPSADRGATPPRVSAQSPNRWSCAAPQAILQPVPFGQIRLTGQIPPPVEFGDALEPADDFTPLPIGIMALLAPCLVE
jgi:hypothetical protein